MKFFLLFLLTVAAPAAAQSIHPTIYGQRFCQLRELGVDSAAARKAAVAYSYDDSRSSLFVKQDIAAGVDYIFTHCRSLVD